MNSPDKGAPNLESLGKDPSEELSDATLTRIIQDLYSQVPKDIPDIGLPEVDMPVDVTDSVTEPLQPLTHGMGQPTMPGMNQIGEYSDPSFPGIADVSLPESGLTPTGDLPENDAGEVGTMVSPHAPEKMIPYDDMDETAVEPVTSIGGEVIDTDMDMTTTPEPKQFESFNPYFVAPSVINESSLSLEGMESLQSSPASESMLQGTRGIEDTVGLKQIPDTKTDPSSIASDGVDPGGIPLGLSEQGSFTPDVELDVSKLMKPSGISGSDPVLTEFGSDETLSNPQGFTPSMTNAAPSEVLTPTISPQMPSAGQPLDVQGSESMPSDQGHVGALQSPHASEGALKGVRSSDDLPAGKQIPTGIESAAAPVKETEEVGTTHDQFNLHEMVQGESESSHFMLPTSNETVSNPSSNNDVGEYLNVENLKKITERFSFDVPTLFPDDDPVSTTVRDRMDPKKEHPIVEGIARTLIKPFAPTLDTSISSHYGNKGDAAIEEQESSSEGDYPIKKDFPALNQNVHGKPLIWLDSAATSQKPHDVIEKIKEYYHRDNSNVHRGAHTLAARSTNAYEEAREKVQAFIKAESKKEIVFVRGATEAINLVAQSYGRKNIGKGDEILLTEMEHHSNIVPWQFLAQEKGAIIKVVPFTDVGEIDLEVYEKLLNERTKIAAFTHVSNALGTINPVKQMTDLAHRHGAKVLIDACQSLPHMPVRVHDINCDFLVFSGHKMYAPTGIGVLYGKRELLETMPPWQGGGSMIEDVTFEKTVFSDIPAKFEAGTGNIADAVGLGAAIDYLNKIGMENVERFEHELMQYSMNALGSVPGLRLIGTAPNKAGAISFLIEGLDPTEIGTFLDHEGIAVRAGHHCAQPAIRHYGVEGTVRPSLGIYNTKSDIDELVKAIYKAKKALNGGK